MPEGGVVVPAVPHPDMLGDGCVAGRVVMAALVIGGAKQSQSSDRARLPSASDDATLGRPHWGRRCDWVQLCAAVSRWTAAVGVAAVLLAAGLLLSGCQALKERVLVLSTRHPLVW